MTLILELDLDIIKMYHHATYMSFLCQLLQSLAYVQTGTQSETAHAGGNKSMVDSHYFYDVSIVLRNKQKRNTFPGTQSCLTTKTPSGSLSKEEGIFNINRTNKSLVHDFF